MNILTTIVLATLFLTACGGGSSDGDDTESDAPQTITPSNASTNQPDSPNNNTNNPSDSDPGKNPSEDTNSGNNLGNGTTHDGSYCIADDFDPAVDDDHWVSLDSIYNPLFLQDENANTQYLSDKYIVQGTIGILQIEPAFMLILPSFYCNFEFYEENQCRHAFLIDGTVEAKLNNGTLSFTANMETKDTGNEDEDNDLISINATYMDKHYHNGRVDFTYENGKTSTITWSRSEGTEHYRSESSDGSYMEFTEHSDCSGQFSAYLIDDDLKPTLDLDANWSATDFTYYNLCRNDQDDKLSCHEYQP